jgi:hypothetical protein
MLLDKSDQKISTLEFCFHHRPAHEQQIHELVVKDDVPRVVLRVCGVPVNVFFVPANIRTARVSFDVKPLHQTARQVRNRERPNNPNLKQRVQNFLVIRCG